MSCQDGWQAGRTEPKDTDGRTMSELLAQLAEVQAQAQLQQEHLEAALLEAAVVRRKAARAAEKEAAAMVRAAAAEAAAEDDMCTISRQEREFHLMKQRAERAEVLLQHCMMTCHGCTGRKPWGCNDDVEVDDDDDDDDDFSRDDDDDDDDDDRRPSSRMYAR